MRLTSYESVTKNRKETTETEMNQEVEEKLLMEEEARKVTPSKYRSVEKVSHSKGRERVVHPSKGKEEAIYTTIQSQCKDPKSQIVGWEIRGT